MKLQENIFYTKEYKKEIISHILDNIDGYEGSYADDLHCALFNTDYYIIGTYEAKKWCGDNTFNIIEVIREYEEFNFGEVSTDFSNPETVVNMYVYILGAEILSLIEYWEYTTFQIKILDSKTIKEVKTRLNQLKKETR